VPLNVSLATQSVKRRPLASGGCLAALPANPLTEKHLICGLRLSQFVTAPRQDGFMASGCAFSEALALVTSQPAGQSRPYIKITRYCGPRPIDSWVGTG
jgi:hypothetical protein